MSVIRLGHLSLKVMDLDAAIHHYANIIGLVLTERTETQAFLRGRDEQDHHSILLNKSDSAGLDHIGFKVGREEDLAVAEQLITKAGAAVQHISAGEEKGQGRAIRFQLPSQQTIELYYHADKLPYLNGMENPDPVLREGEVAGVKCSRLDHLLISTTDVEANMKFMRDILDFGTSEQLVDDAGVPQAVWLFCTNTMHDMAMSPGPDGGLQHLAFWVDNRSDVVNAVDVFKKNNVRTFDYGLTRHGVSGGTTVYFFDPSGNRNEIFTGPYMTTPVPGRVAPISWDMENFPRGAFYYENELDMNFFGELT
ncbi:MAG: VOC family protein [Gammaproteobacteria bacterium]|nr:VOC family protein [Gammaproteobacteria bacterium]